ANRADGQQNQERWARIACAEQLPGRATLARADPNLDAALSALRGRGCNLVRVDTPPAVSGTVAAVIAAADLVVIPVQATPDDLRGWCDRPGGRGRGQAAAVRDQPREAARPADRRRCRSAVAARRRGAGLHL